MPETETPTKNPPIEDRNRPSGSNASSPAGRNGRDDDPKLETDNGLTTIEDSVVAEIAALAAREVSGVAELGGPVANAFGTVMGKVKGEEHTTAGVKVEVGSEQAAVDLTLKVQYPAPIPDIADAVRRNVSERIEALTGLDVTEVNITVVGLEFDEETTGQDRPDGRRQNRSDTGDRHDSGDGSRRSERGAASDKNRKHDDHDWDDRDRNERGRQDRPRQESSASSGSSGDGGGRQGGSD